MWKISLFLSLVSYVASNSDGGKNWALLVAGSSGFYNYRHQADVCHAYQLLHENGVPDENILVMMVDDIAYSADNPTPGVIINHVGGPNVYERVPRDYVGKDVNPQVFLDVLTGNKTGVKGIGSGRVIESGPNDHIFVNFVDHGGPGILCFPDTVLHADELVSALKIMANKSMFAKMILYIEACHAGSIFNDMLPDDMNIMVVTAADPFESSFACCFDDLRNTYLGDVFSVTWINDSEHESLPAESIHHQFERVRSLTNTSHVEEYGDLDIGGTKLSQFIGFKMRLNLNREPLPPIREDDVVSNTDVQLEVLNKKLKAEKDHEKKHLIVLEKEALIKTRHLLDETFSKFINAVSGNNMARYAELTDSRYSLRGSNYPCYKTLLTSVDQRCFNVAQSPYLATHLQKLINICAVDWVKSISEVISSIEKICDHPQIPRLSVA